MRVMIHSLIAIAIVSIQSVAHADLLIGRLGSLVSPIAGPGTLAASQGFETYLKKVNGSSYLYGQSIRVIFKDDGFKPENTLAAAKELIDKDNVLAIVNPQGTLGTVALLKDGVLQRSRTAVVGPITGALEVLSGENIFPMRSSYEDEVAGIAQQMQTIGQMRVAYLYYNTSQGPIFEPTFAKIVKAKGLKYVGAAGFDIVPDAAKQIEAVDAAVSKLTALKPDAIFIFAVGPTFPLSVKSMNRLLGRGVSRYTFSINNWENLIKQVGLQEAQGMIFSQSVPYPYSSARAVSREYQKDSAALSPDVKISFSGFEGYLTARMVVEALHRAGAKPTREKVLRALLDMGRYDMGDYFVQYSPEQRRVQSSIDITSIGTSGKLIR
jgi:branched-chain amino acid transport system substrate-binding protein